MRHQLGFLREPVPVVLDPVARLAWPEKSTAETWRLPQRDGSRVLLTFGGTAALYQAALALQLAKGDRILVPAYNCGHEIEPLLRAGATVACYRIDEKFMVDLDHLQSLLDDSTRAVLITHYFGFPQPVRAIRELCDHRGIVVIEDCAHALFSADATEPLGLAGHMSVFSLRKTLPLPHGGALVSHDPRWPIAQHLKRPPTLSTAPKILERHQKAWLLPRLGRAGYAHRTAFVASRLLVDMARGLRSLAHTLGATQLDPDDESLDFPSETLHWGVAASVENRLFQAHASSIVAARRRNYELLLAQAHRFKKARPALPQLPAGVCPLYFPLLSEDANEEVRHLQRNAVATIEWWASFHPAIPWVQFPEASRLKRQVIALPIHQDLNDEHMQRIIDLLADRRT